MGYTPALQGWHSWSSTRYLRKKNLYCYDIPRRCRASGSQLQHLESRYILPMYPLNYFVMCSNTKSKIQPMQISQINSQRISKPSGERCFASTAERPLTTLFNAQSTPVSRKLSDLENKWLFNVISKWCIYIKKKFKKKLSRDTTPGKCSSSPGLEIMLVYSIGLLVCVSSSVIVKQCIFIIIFF